MRVKTKRVVTVEMDNSDFAMLLDTLEEASQVRSKLFPLLNQKANTLRDELVEAGGGRTRAQDE